MTNHTVYGELQSEVLAADSQAAHQIVKEINHFGINDRQRWLIINALALELEDVQDMKALTNFVRDHKGKSLFITKIYGVADQEEDL